MKKLSVFLLLCLSISIFSCRKDFSSIPTSGNLEFSKDTVFLDTVFSNISSSTYTLKVYNRSNSAINIPIVKLQKGFDSNYRLNVDGTPGKIFEDVMIRKRDSLYIFIETTIDINNTQNPIYIDEIVFESDVTTQQVKLVTLVKDTHFLYPNKNTNGIIESISLGTDSEGESISIQGFYLEGSTTFTNDKPYVIYGYCAIPENETLTVEEGTSIYFHENSGIICSKNASLQIEGTLEKPVILQGDRLESEFSEIPGQWGTVWLRAGSLNNKINYAVIKNSSIGVLVDSTATIDKPTLEISNTKIFNNSNFGILGRETSILGKNLVINNSGQSSLACTVGGTYNFYHSTFANYWMNHLREYPAVLINNYYTYFDGTSYQIETKDLHQANFYNCIIDGNKPKELIIDNGGNSEFNYFFENNLIQFQDSNNTFSNLPEYDFTDSNKYQNVLLNGNTSFLDPYENDMRIDTDSDAIKKASNFGTFIVPIDILGVTRTLPADIGAYQFSN